MMVFLCVLQVDFSLEMSSGVEHFIYEMGEFV